MNRKLALFFTVIFGIVLLFGCGKKGEIVGPWEVSISGIPEMVEMAEMDITETVIGTWTFKEDGISELEIGENTRTIHYSISRRTTIEFTEIEGACKDIIGGYRYRIKGNIMTFTSISDECPNRADGMELMTLKKVE